MNDKVLAPNLTLPTFHVNPAKPPYLIEFKGKSAFLCIEKPLLQPSWVEAKGIRLSKEELVALKDNKDIYKELLSKENKDSILEVIYPWSDILSIQNLLYKAFK